MPAMFIKGKKVIVKVSKGMRGVFRARVKLDWLQIGYGNLVERLRFCREEQMHSGSSLECGQETSSVWHYTNSYLWHNIKQY